MGLLTCIADGLVVGAVDGTTIGLTVGPVDGLKDGLDVGWDDGAADGVEVIGRAIGSTEGTDDTIVAAGGAAVGVVLTGTGVSTTGGLVSIDTGGIGPLGALDGTSLGVSLGLLLGN